jgi:endonuclease YncB( thermonuclease family)
MPRCPNQNDHPLIKPSDRNKTIFAIIRSIISNRKRLMAKHVDRMLKVQSALCKRFVPLGGIERYFHLVIVATINRTVKHRRYLAAACLAIGATLPAAAQTFAPAPEFSIPASGVQFITGDTWRIKGAIYRLFGVQACIRGTQFQNAAGGVSDCGEASIAYFASLIVDTRPKCRPLFQSDANGSPAITYVVCQAHVGENSLDLGTIIVTQGFGFAATARDGDNWKPVYFPYSVAEAGAKKNGRGLWAGVFSHPTLALQRAQRP